MSRVGAVLRARPRLRRTAVLLNLAVALAGAGLVAYPFATDAWSARVLQPRAEAQFASPALAAAYRSDSVRTASALTRMRIPALGVDTVVVEGVTVSALRAGAGHYPDTPLPGERGNVAIAGHRTTYGKPFRRLDTLAPGDEIEFETPVGRFVYRVARAPFVVDPHDLSVLEQDQRSLLTLTTCHPVDSARERLVVQAVLVS